jgi:hypothetical protein
MDGLKIVGGDRIRMPERRRFDPDEACMFNNEKRLSFDKEFPIKKWDNIKENFYVLT